MQLCVGLMLQTVCIISIVGLLQVTTVGVLCIIRRLHTKAHICQGQWQVLITKCWCSGLLDGERSYSDKQMIGQHESHSLGCCNLVLVVHASCMRHHISADMCLLVSQACIQPAQAQSCLHTRHPAERCSVLFTQQCLSLPASCMC